MKKLLIQFTLFALILNLTGTALAADIEGDEPEIPDGPDTPPTEDIPDETETGCEDDFYEPTDGIGNDALPFAVAMTEGSYALTLCHDSKEDWYRVELADGETLNTDISFDHATADLILELWTEEEEQLVIANSSSLADGTETADYTVTQGQSLYVRVFTTDTSFTTAPYTLNIDVDVAVLDDSYEPNNSMLAWDNTDEVIRTTLMPGTYELMMSDEADYFVLPGVVAESTLNIELGNFDGEQANLDLFLLDSKGNSVRSSTNTEGSVELIEGFDPAELGVGSGNYYLLVQNTNGVVNMNYTLHITLTEGPDLQVVSFRYIAPEDAVTNGYEENTNGYFEYTLKNKGTVNVDPNSVNEDLTSEHNRYHAVNRLMIVNSKILDSFGGDGEDRVLLSKAWRDQKNADSNSYLFWGNNAKKQYLDLDAGGKDDFYVQHLQTGLNLVFVNVDGMKHIYENNETNNWKKLYLCVEREEGEEIRVKDMWTVSASSVTPDICTK